LILFWDSTVSTAIDRRTFLILGAGGLAALAGPAGVSGAAIPRPRYLSVRLHRDTGRYLAAVADAHGRTLRAFDLPGRGHFIAARPGHDEAVAFARRPGTFALAFPTGEQGEARPFETPEDRHFQGHGVFDATGRTLFTTENDFDGERSVIGIYDAADGYRRIGEMPSHGIGAHQLALMPDGKTLAVANGGILTHPDMGRTKLNIPTMRPSLAYIEAASGRLADQWAPAPERQRKLSIRHLAVLAHGRVAFACQDQQPMGDVPALAFVHKPGAGAPLTLAAPDTVYQAMAGYCGSVATANGLIAVSAPRGNRIVFWDAASATLTGEILLADGCGVAAGPEPGTFALSSGDGRFVISVPGAGQKPTSTSPAGAAWDNHLTRVFG
jgi:hypothetical protein